MNYALYILAALNILAAIVDITQIGKPRKPITPGLAAATTVTCAITATLLIIAATKL